MYVRSILFTKSPLLTKPIHCVSRLRSFRRLSVSLKRTGSRSLRATATVTTLGRVLLQRLLVTTRHTIGLTEGQKEGVKEGVCRAGTAVRWLQSPSVCRKRVSMRALMCACIYMYVFVCAFVCVSLCMCVIGVNPGVVGGSRPLPDFGQRGCGWSQGGCGGS